VLTGGGNFDGPVERHALARPSSSDRPESGRRLLQRRRPALALAEYPKRIAKIRPESWAGDLPPKTEAARAGRADYGRLLPLQIRHMDCGCAVSMARILAIRRAFTEAARGNRLNLDGEHGHGSERYGESEFPHVNLRRLSNGAVLNHRTPDGSAAMRFVPPAPTLSRARPARPVLHSSVQVPCNHSCEAVAPVRLISVHRRRNLNGDSLMHTVD
jgi:hypothetical protein